MQLAGAEGRIRIGVKELLRLRRAARAVSLGDGRTADAPGARNSLFRGRGMEYEESRPYLPGDDLRSLDWRVTARTGKAYTKLFQVEHERPVLPAFDLSPSMFFATRGRFKAVQAAHLGVLLAWAALAAGERLGALIWGAHGHLELRPRRSIRAVPALIRHLVNYPGWGRVAAGATPTLASASTSLADAMLRLARLARPGSLLCLLSDFRNLDSRGVTGLARLARHSDLLLVLFYDPLEATLPPPGRYQVTDGQLHFSFQSGSHAARRYAAHMRERRKMLAELAHRPGLRLLECSTTDDPLQVLSSPAEKSA